jgi:UDP:flavonoid glycosyltransferase YjiC (YdhE family)
MKILQTLMAFSGNAPPQLAVTRELVARGHEVRVLAHRAAAERVRATGAELIEIERAVPDFDISRRETDTLRDWAAPNRYRAGMRLRDHGQLDLLPGIASECAGLLVGWPADAVVFDWVLIGAAVAAEAAGVPAAALVHCPYPMPIPGAPPLFSGAGWRGGSLGTVRNAALNRVFLRFSAAGLPLLNEVRRQHGLAALGHWEDQMKGSAAVYVMTAPELDFSSRGELPANVAYVGPAFEPFPRDRDSPWDEEADLPLVLASFSTSYMDQADLAQRVLDALADLPVRGILTAGPALETEKLRVPANVKVFDYLPHRTVLPHADLMITHAGWQTINAALVEGVPLLCLPDGRDQPDNAARVVAAGAGLRASKNASPRRLQEMIEAALADCGLREGAGGMKHALSRRDGAVAVADRLAALVSRTGSPTRP